MRSYGLVLVAVSLIGVGAFAQERKPSAILQAEHAGILLGAGRVELENPELTLDIMGLKDGDIVADLGCGNGFYTLRVAKRIGPHGHVLASDIQQGMLDQLTERMAEAEIRNVFPILGTFTDPYLPPGKVDWVLMTDVYHEFAEPLKMLEKIKACLAPGGKVMLLEYRAEQTEESMKVAIPRDHKMTVDEVLREWIPAGFELVERLEVLPAQHSFIFRIGEGKMEYNSVKVGDVLNVTSAGQDDKKNYFAGQPGEADFETFAKMGVKTIVNIRTQREVDSIGFDEKAAAEALGLKYVHVPMGGEMLSDGELNGIFDELDKGGVLLHCASSNRVGGVWGMYRLKRGNVTVERALEEGKAAGLGAAPYIAAIEAAGKN